MVVIILIKILIKLHLKINKIVMNLAVMNLINQVMRVSKVKIAYRLILVAIEMIVNTR